MNDNILQCNCNNEYQDKIYGNKQRVHTVTQKGHRCTCCGLEKGSGVKKSK